MSWLTLGNLYSSKLWENIKCVGQQIAEWHLILLKKKSFTILYREYILWFIDLSVYMKQNSDIIYVPKHWQIMFSGWLERRGKNRGCFIDYKVMVFAFCLNYYPLTTNALSHFVVNLLYWKLSLTCLPWYQIFLLCLHFLQLIFLISCLSPLSSTYVLSMDSRRLWAKLSYLLSFIFSSYFVIYYDITVSPKFLFSTFLRGCLPSSQYV